MEQSTQPQFVTLDIFNETIKSLMGRFDDLDAKMMQGFSDLNHKIDLVDQASERRDKALERKIDLVAQASEQRDRALEIKMELMGQASEQRDKALERKIDLIDSKSERRDKALAGQIQHLLMTKADWPEEA